MSWLLEEGVEDGMMHYQQQWEDAVKRAIPVFHSLLFLVIGNTVAYIVTHTTLCFLCPCSNNLLLLVGKCTWLHHMFCRVRWTSFLFLKTTEFGVRLLVSVFCGTLRRIQDCYLPSGEQDTIGIMRPLCCVGCQLISGCSYVNTFIQKASLCHNG